MIPCLIKNARLRMDRRGFSLMELMMAIAFSSFLMIGVYGFYHTASQSYNSGVTGQALQDASNIILSKIIEGEEESGTVYRLSTAASYMIPNGSTSELYSCGGSAQKTPCNNGSSFSELYYCQDSPCTGSTDPTARWYYLNSTSTSVIYHHPVPGGKTVEETIYSAPIGSSITLRFSPAAVSTPLNVIEIDVALTENLAANITNQRLATSGAASTFVLLRDHP